MTQATGELYSISALARLCGRDRATVVKCLKDVKPVEERTKEKLYALGEAVPAIIAGADAEMDEAKLRKVQAEADLKELDLKRETGEVVSVKEVRNYAQTLVQGIHQRIAVRMPGEISPQLYKAESSSQIAEILQHELGRIFNDLRDDHKRFL